MRVGPTKSALAVAVAVAMVASPALAAEGPDSPAAGPKLVVLVVVDQMRADYVDWYGRQWSSGLERLVKRGAHFSNARYPYLHTVTCAGHATVGTGAYPNHHGMVLNGWWVEELGKVVQCTEDPDERALPYGDSRASMGYSARSLLLPTLGDAFKRQLSSESRVVAFSVKARSAIVLAGSQADLVTWYEGGGWATSTAYAAAPSPIMASAVEQLSMWRTLGRPWTRALPVKRYRFEDDVAVEQPGVPFWNRAFPHPLRPPKDAQTKLTPLVAWERSPFPDEALIELAIASIRRLRLGRGPQTDYLAVSLSALDTVGHAFGPKSHEVQDTLVRIDRLLGRLFSVLDRQVGRRGYVFGLTSDHGVAIYPESADAPVDSGRVPLELLEQKLDGAIEHELGPGKYVALLSYTDVYLAGDAFARLQAKPGALDRVRLAARTVPGVAEAFWGSDLRSAPPAVGLEWAASLSYYPGRSGDLIVAPKSNWLTTSKGTTHGSQNEYDQRVPLLLYGAGIKPGRYDGLASPADLAPTLAQVVGLSMPEADGRPLVEALRVVHPPSAARVSPPSATP